MCEIAANPALLYIWASTSRFQEWQLLREIFKPHYIHDFNKLNTMTVLFAAGTVLVNPPGALPVLTLEQLWAALELKRRYVIDLVMSF
jgi:hypothetical protein